MDARTGKPPVASAEARARTGRVVVGLGEEPDVLFQDISGRHSTWAVLAPMMLKLTRYDDQWRPWPELAATLPCAEDGTWRRDRDGRVVTVHRIQPGLRWHDGRPLRASDAVATYRFLRELGEEYPHREIVKAIEAMDTDADDLALRVTWSADAQVAPYEEWGTVLPVHRLAAAERARPSLAALRRLAHQPVLHGPFRFGLWKPGQYLQLVRAGSAHPRGRPMLAEIVFRFYQSPAALRDAAAAGQVDVTEISGFCEADLDSVLETNPAHRASVVASSLWEHLDFNLADPVLADVRVRRALAHALDRDALVRRHYGRYAEVAHSWLPVRHPAHHPDVPRTHHDPEHATTLLHQAGYRRDVTGRLVGADGEPVRLSILTTAPGTRWSAASHRTAVAEDIAAAWRRLGIETAVRTLPSQEAFARFRSRDFPHAALFAWSIGPEANGYLMWHSSQIPTRSTDYGINVPGWLDAHNDALLEELVAEGSPERRRRLLMTQQLRWGRELPSIPLTFIPQLNTFDARLSPLRHVGTFGTYVTWNAWEWRWTA